MTIVTFSEDLREAVLTILGADKEYNLEFTVRLPETLPDETVQKLTKLGVKCLTPIKGMMTDG